MKLVIDKIFNVPSTHTLLPSSSPNCPFLALPPGLLQCPFPVDKICFSPNTSILPIWLLLPVPLWPFFELLVFFSSVASIELHSFIKITLFGQVFQEDLRDCLAAPNHSAATIVGRGRAKFTGTGSSRKQERPRPLHNFYCRLNQSSSSSGSAVPAAAAPQRISLIALLCGFHQGLELP